MKIKELIKELRKMDQNRVVVMSSDSEGNYYSELGGLVEMAFDSEEQIVGLEELSKDDEEKGYTEEDVIVGKKAVVFYPC